MPEIDIHSFEFTDALRGFCLQYLDSLHCSQWGRNWSIYEGTERTEAADWLAVTLTEVIEIASRDDT